MKKMNKTNSKVYAIIISAAMMSVLSACGAEKEADSKTSSNQSEIVVQEEAKPEETKVEVVNASGNETAKAEEGKESEGEEISDATGKEAALSMTEEEYMEEYKSMVDSEFGDAASVFTYKLIYINDDDIPELYYSGDCEAVGSGVIYINPEGKAEIVMMSRLAGAYEERKNFFYHGQGHSGYNYDEFYSMVDGHLELVDSGEYTTEFDENAIDADGYQGDWVPVGCTFDGENISVEDYDKKIDSMLDGRQLVYLQEWFYTKDGQPIDSEEYWDHWGEEGYYGGTALLTYEETFGAM